MTSNHARQLRRSETGRVECTPGAGRTPLMSDVAVAAGVSLATVSRVLTGSLPVSPARQLRVRQAIDDLGYRRSVAARALVLGRSDMVAVVADLSSTDAAEIVSGIAARARLDGQPVVLAAPDPDGGGIAKTMSLLAHNAVRAVIVVTGGSLEAPSRNDLPEGTTVVAVGQRPMAKDPDAPARPPSGAVSRVQDGVAAYETLICRKAADQR